MSERASYQELKRRTEDLVSLVRADLRSAELEIVLGFVGVGEFYLALDTVCEQLFEHSVPVSAPLRHEILSLLADLGVDDLHSYEQILCGVVPKKENPGPGEDPGPE